MFSFYGSFPLVFFVLFWPFFLFCLKGLILLRLASANLPCRWVCPWISGPPSVSEELASQILPSGLTCTVLFSGYWFLLLNQTEDFSSPNISVSLRYEECCPGWPWIFFFFLCLFVTGFHFCGLGWPGIHYEDQVCLELIEVHLPVSWVLGLKARATITNGWPWVFGLP